MSAPFLKVTEDLTDAFNNIVKALQQKETLVGIPEKTTERKKDDAEGTINNATILFINEHGSPAQNIPARPVMAIGIRKAQDDIAEQFKKAAQSSLKSGTYEMDKYYERAGFVATNSIKNVINNQTDIQAPAESTLAARRARGFKGDKALIVTGQLRNAITHVVVNAGSLLKKGG